ncbi:hypothetical protein BGX38DRAFT_1142391 [Terfezia claveryi]|nr:hypothetical protein BGX38DRAFT_1142391 [Terfezia claveryi]
MENKELLRFKLCPAVKVHFGDVSFEWTTGSKNRELDEDHVQSLKIRFQSSGLDRRSPNNYCQVLASKKSIQKWLSVNQKSKLTEGDRMDDFYRITGEKFEVQAGQHRFNALVKYMTEVLQAKGLHGDGLASELKNKCWWYAEVFDSQANQDPKAHLELEAIRLNPEADRKPDCDGDIWMKWVYVDRWFNGLPDEDRKALQPKCQALKDSATAKSKMSLVYKSPFCEQITELLKYPYFKHSFNPQNMEGAALHRRIVFYWKEVLEKQIGFLQGITCTQPQHLTKKSWESLIILQDPNERDAASAFYPNGIRNPDLFPDMSDGQYRMAYDAITTTFKETPLWSWRDLGTKVRSKATIYNLVVVHFCRWINPIWMNESRQATIKVSAEDLWRAQLSKTDLEELQNEFIQLSHKTIIKSAS